MAEASKLPAAKPGKRKKGCGCLIPSLGVAFLFVLLGIALGPMTGSISKAKALATMMYTREIALSMEQYAADHNGQYPTGKSSTEIFQKLMDEGYVSDPSIFVGGYPRLNKVALTNPTEKLKPENVGFDVTILVDASSPENLPLVFLTGYRINYSAGANALPLSSDIKDRIPCIAVGYKDASAAYVTRGTLRCPARGYSNPESGSVWGPGALSDGTIPHFIPTNFDPKGKKYVQLTPDGPLGRPERMAPAQGPARATLQRGCRSGKARLSCGHARSRHACGAARKYRDAAALPVADFALGAHRFDFGSRPT